MSTASESIVRDIPRDVIIDILNRLPVRSILRFKCVCKSWYVIITNPTFAKTHFKPPTLALEDDNCFLYTKNYLRNSSNFSRPVTLLSNDQAIDIKINIQIPFLTMSKPFRVSGTCNGLICLSILPLGSIILLWNPNTREFKDLPVSRIRRPNAGPIKVVLGFGYDPVSDDYKVLRIVYYSYPLNQVEIYSLRSNSWREIKTTVQSLIFESASSVFFNGRFHWSAAGFGEMNGSKSIVSFGVLDEKFGYMITPPDIGLVVDDDVEDDDDSDDEDDKFRWNLLALKDFLAVIAYGRYGIERKFDIWVMKEYGVTSSWSKYMSFGLQMKIDRALGCSKSGKILLEKDCSELISYDTNNQTVKLLGDHNVACFSEVFNHVETLLPIRGGKTVDDVDVDEIGPDYFFVRKYDLVQA